MKKSIFPKPAIEARHRSGMIGAHFDNFLNWMRERGYALESMRYNIQRITNFGKYLKRRGIRSIRQLDGTEGQKLMVDYQKYCKARGHSDRSASIRLYMQALRDAGVLGASPSNNTSMFRETKEYTSFLRNQRELSECTIRNHQYWIERFLRFLGCKNGTDFLAGLIITDVDRFIQQEGSGLSRRTQRHIAGCLRGFFRFLYQSGKITRDLSLPITSPRCYKLGTLHRVLCWDEVNKILHSVDRTRKAGLRDYAILLLLTTYGLRAGEVARLKLGDIDWRKETIHIVGGKTGRDLWLPLIAQVGKAILKYLKNARPPSKYRQIFLLTCAPRTPLKSGNIRYVVARNIQHAGLNPPRRGSHLIRYSFATHLIRGGASLKEIGDILGHRSLESTHIYTKTATEKLREVALEVPEVK